MTGTTHFALDVHGPVYTPPPAAAKFRKLAARRPLSDDEGHEYGAAVLAGIRAMQRAALMRELPSHRHPCVSGTTYSEGRQIIAAMRKKQAAEMEAAVREDRARRTDAQLKTQYEAAMAAKRARTV